MQLNKEVNRVVWDKSNNSKNVEVKCKDGTVYNADHVIVTPSLGVLKEVFRTWFKPELPLSKTVAIEGLGISVVNKIFLKFPRRFWPKDCTGFSFIWDENDDLSQENLWLTSIFGFYTIDSDPDVLMGWSVGKYAGDFEKLPKETIEEGCVYVLKKFIGREFSVTKPIDIIW